MRIFFITPKVNFKTIGGSLIEYDLMIRTLQKLGNDVTVVTAFSYANAMTEGLPYKIIEESIMARGLLGIQKGVFKILSKYSDQADFFYIDGQVFLYGAGLYRRLGGKTPVSAYFNRELVCWPDGEANFLSQNNIFINLKKTLRFYIEKYIGTPFANGIDLMLFTNPYLQRTYEKFGLRPRADRALIFGDPVDHSKYMKEQGITEESYIKRNKTGGRINVFYSSRMVPGKGFDVLLTAFSKIKNKEKFNLILGGTGPGENDVKKMISNYHLGPYVELFGWVPRETLYSYLKRADIFIQPRWRTDLTSMSLIDAMIFGIPSIMPGGGGLQWDAKDSGLYFKDGDSDDLARKIEQLGGSSELRAKLSKACYVRLAENEMNADWQINRWNEKMKEIKILK